MSEFITVLRERVQGEQRKPAAARDAQHDFEIDLHITRMLASAEAPGHGG